MAVAGAEAEIMVKVGAGFGTLAIRSRRSPKKWRLRNTAFWDHIYCYKLLLSHVLSQQQGFPFLLAKKIQPVPEPP